MKTDNHVNRKGEVVSGDALAISGKARITIADAARLANETADKIKSEYAREGETNQECDVLTRALAAAEARCAQLLADNEALRTERDGFAKRALELRADRDALKEYADNVAAQRDYYADRVAEAKSIITYYALFSSPVTSRDNDDEPWITRCHECGNVMPKTGKRHDNPEDHAPDCMWVQSTTWLSKPAAWARDDKESGK